MIALFDTNAVSYWLGGNEQFRLRLKALIGELRRQRATLAISAVTLQEIMVYARIQGTADKDHAFLAERFNILPFDEPCALAAAKVAALVGSPNRPDKRKARGRAGTHREKDVWQRDAAIAGTAEYHGLDLLVTADGGLHGEFRHHLTKCEVRLLEEDPVPMPEEGSKPPDA